jgi:hypothetical protein
MVVARADNTVAVDISLVMLYSQKVPLDRRRQRRKPIGGNMSYCYHATSAHDLAVSVQRALSSGYATSYDAQIVSACNAIVDRARQSSHNDAIQSNNFAQCVLNGDVQGALSIDLR